MDYDQDWLENWSRRSNPEIASAWISFQSRPHATDLDLTADEDWWAVDAITGLINNDPLRALEIVFLIARSSLDAGTIEMLGAGPLEDLLSGGAVVLESISVEATISPNLKAALRSTWKNAMPDDVWTAVQRLAEP